ncbi:MAG TPA: hypothetical protein VF530_14685 [Planctomycetota bacterium]
MRVLLVLALLAACERVAPPAAPAGQGLVAGNPLLARPDARQAVAHRGTRRLEFPAVAGAASSYRERITTDGQGGFALEPLDAHLASAGEWVEFELVQRVREGFLFRYRDFAVRDPERFARNWSTSTLPRTEVVAGRDCALYRVERRQGEPRAFELALEPESGLILASREYDAGGRLVAEMRYETLQLAPDLSAVAWHQSGNLERPVDVPALATELGVRCLEPRLLPAGYGPFEVATVQDDEGTTWLKRTYSDGIETLFFLQALERASRSTGAASAGAGVQDVEAGKVMVFELGSARAVQGRVEGFRILAVGKVGETELLDLVESALP